MVTVTGGAGAVPGSYTVFLQSLQTGQSIETTSASDGSFETQVLAPDESTVAISYGDDSTQAWRQGSPVLQITINPKMPLSPTEIPFTTAAPDRFGTGYWVAEGVQNGWSFQQGQTIEYTIDLTYTSPNIDETLDVDLDSEILRFQPQLTFSRISDGKGKPIQATLVPVLMAPTGLPIFSRSGYEQHPYLFGTIVQGAERVDTEVDVRAAFSYAIPEWLPSGYYVGKIDWMPSSLWAEGRSDIPPIGNEEGLLLRSAATQTLLPAFRIGVAADPQIPWVLLANTLSNGTRGAVAREDESSFELGTKVAFNADKFIIPKDDLQLGEPLSYRLEPFLPTVGYLIGGPDRLAPPLISFLFPSGELHVTVTRPNGTTDDLGTAPFRSGRAKKAMSQEMIFGPTSLLTLYELTTLDPSFEYQFDEYGQYVVIMEGWVQDATGTTYRGGGTYDVYVAETLDLDLGTFLNTPFEVGDVMSPVVHVRPGVPADVQIDLTLFPNSSTKDVLSQTVTGQANPFGYFHPGNDAEQLAITAPGEYVVDITASYTDSSGALWMGALKGASVVEAPGTTLVAHGRRGLRLPGQELKDAPSWFFARNIDPPGQTGDEPGTNIQLLYPYHTGDIAWASDAGVAIAPFITVHDPDGVTNLALEPQNQGKGATGEMEVLFPKVRPGEFPGVQYPEVTNELAYFYTSVQRPGVTVRSFIGTGDVQRSYWQFGDPYNGQLGNGNDGDRPGDIKLQYGGIVYRDTDSGVNEYAIYGSMAVMIPAGTPLGQRVFPPFQGAAGGPSGGPILTIKGQEIDIFFTPVGVMPGSVLEVGDTFSFSGAMWPTLPSLAEITVTTPSGETVALEGRANKIGYLYSSDDDFVVTKPGIYTVNVRVTHDGMTSAGPVEEPFPTGGILGTSDGSYVFYVVPDGSANAFTIDTPRTGGGIIREERFGGNYGFTISGDIPSGLTNVSLHFTTNMTGTVLESGPLLQQGEAFSYTYDVMALNADFPNVDPNPGDTIVVTLVVTGEDTSGQSTAYARQVLFQGTDVFALAES